MSVEGIKWLKWLLLSVWISNCSKVTGKRIYNAQIITLTSEITKNPKLSLCRPFLYHSMLWTVYPAGATSRTFNLVKNRKELGRVAAQVVRCSLFVGATNARARSPCHTDSDLRSRRSDDKMGFSRVWQAYSCTVKLIISANMLYYRHAVECLDYYERKHYDLLCLV